MASPLKFTIFLWLSVTCLAEFGALAATTDATVDTAETAKDYTPQSHHPSDETTENFDILKAVHNSVPRVLKDSTIFDGDERVARWSPSVAGTYGFEVRVTDGCSSFTDQVNYEVKCHHECRPNAGGTQRVTKDCKNPEKTISLSGMFERKPDVEYNTFWSFTTIPEASFVDDGAIQRSDSLEAFFVPDTLGTYEVAFTVQDCCGESFDTNVIEFACNESPAVKVEKTNVEVFLKNEVVIDASKSTDPEDDPLTYGFTFVQVPPGSNLEGHELTHKVDEPAKAEFIADVQGEYVVEVTVSDCCSTSTKNVFVTAVCNEPPTANAGSSVDITGIQEIFLDGSGSSDPDADRLIFAWSFESVPETSELTDESIKGYNVELASFTPDKLGMYEIVLRVSDCCSSSLSRKRVNVGCNNRPTAIAGEDKSITSIRPFPTITLDGCRSTDEDGDDLVYLWEFTGVPAKSLRINNDIIHSTSCLAEFTPDVIGSYTVKLIVSDNCLSHEDTVRVVVGCNSLPEAHAGSDQEVPFCCSESTVNLDGSLSKDADGDDLTYEWTFKTVPSGSELRNADLFDSEKKWSSFTPDALGTYVVALTVTDSCTSTTDTVEVQYVCNASPVASAGVDKQLQGQFPWTEDIVLDGSNSADPDSDNLRFFWKFTSLPWGSELTDAAIVGPDQVMPAFRPDVEGQYELELTVSDCCSEASDAVIITVTCGAEPTANANYDKYLIQDCDVGCKTVELDGSNSYHPYDLELKFAWSFVSVPEGSTVTNENIIDADKCIASVTICPADRVEGHDEYVLQLAVSDSCRTVTDEIKITYCCNDEPSANAGKDQVFAAAPPFPPVELDGSASSDPNEDSIFYEWAFFRTPDNSALGDENILDSDKALASFIPDKRGEYELLLTVFDCCSSICDRVKVTVTCDSPPTAVAGQNQIVSHKCEGINEFILDGSQSSDPDLEQLQYTWTFEEIPLGSSATEVENIVNADAEVAKLLPDVTGNYVLKLTVSDGCSVVSDTTTVTYVCNGMPHAVASDDQTVVSNPPHPAVDVDGIGSTDPNGPITEYSWEFTIVPPGSLLEVGNPLAVSKTLPSGLGGQFIPDVPGCYELELDVQGCCGSSKSVTKVCVQCNEAPHAIAGPDQEFVKGAVTPHVEIDGCDSYDPDNDQLDFAWSFSKLPATSELDATTLVGGRTCRPSFIPDATGVYELELTVYDGCTLSRDKTVVRYRCNNTPVPDAGIAQSVTKSCFDADLIHLDGENSFDIDGEALTYRWTFLDKPAGSLATIVDADKPRASFVPDEFGLYEVELEVADYCFSTTDSTVITYQCNDAPVANAGSDQDITAYPFPLIYLYGTDSKDDNDDVLEFSWNFLSLPTESELVVDDIIDRTKARAVFHPDVAGVFMLQLSVADCCSVSTDEVKITIIKKGCDNDPPVPNAGDDIRHVKVCGGIENVVTLDGSNTFDPENNTLTYKWKFAKKPERSLISNSLIKFSTSPVAQFTPDVAGQYIMMLTVSDSCSTVSSELVVDYVCNHAPDAVAGDDKIIPIAMDDVNARVTLDGGASSDADGDELLYRWSFISKPEGSCLVDHLLVREGAQASFTPDERGCYTLRLFVSDCCSTSFDDVEVCIQCNSAPEPDAGDDQEVFSCPPFPRVFLCGQDLSGSDPNNLIWSWDFISTPAGSQLAHQDIRGSSQSNAFFAPDEMGEYVLELTLNDGCSRRSDQVRVSVGCNDGPNANAGNDISVQWDGEKYPKVVLDGCLSSDPDGDALHFRWAFKNVPVDSTLTNDAILNSNACKASFWPTQPGDYELQLTTIDCCSPSHDRVLVHVGCNGPPTVHAGEDIVVKKSCEPTIVELHGIATDPEEDKLTYTWSFVTVPPGSTLGNRHITNFNTDTVSFEPDVTGSFFEINFCAFDGCSKSCDRVKVEYECNDPPQADAGADQSLTKTCDDQLVQLDGSGSYDPEDDPLTYAWRFTSVPKGSKAEDTLSNPAAISPTFKPDRVGVYELELTVKDCCEFPAFRCTCMRDRVLIKLDCIGEPPKADAGDDFFVNWDETKFPTAHLDASRTVDADHDRLYFEWFFHDVPERSTLSDHDIRDRNNPIASFLPDVAGIFTMEVCVSDCCYRECDTVVVDVHCDNPPKVMAGADQSVVRQCKGCEGGCTNATPVFLDGSDSSDPDKEDLTCNWSFLCKPPTSCLSDEDIHNADSVNAFFNADILGEYVMELTCFDGCSYVSDEVVVNTACNDKPLASAVIQGAKTANFVQDCGENELVVLDGTQSSDADEDELTYEWKFVSVPEASELLDESIFNADAAEASFRPDAIGEYRIKLTVADCCQSDSSEVTVEVRCTEPPVAEAGENTSFEWDGVDDVRITLDGSDTRDPDTEHLQYRWSIVEIPRGSILTDADIFKSDGHTATFSPDDFGCYTFKLTVSDCCSSDFDTVEVCAECSNADSADAGVDETIEWECQAFLPLEVNVVGQGDLNNDKDISFEWRLIDFDGNNVPSVDAGCDFEATVDSVVYLTESLVEDLDSEDTLAFSWTFSEVPFGSLLTVRDLHGRHNRHAHFTPDKEGIYVARLEVTDGVSVASDEVTIKVSFGAEDDVPQSLSAVDGNSTHSSWRTVALSVIGVLSVVTALFAANVVFTVKMYRKLNDNGIQGPRMTELVSSFRRGNSTPSISQSAQPSSDDFKVKV